MITNKKVTLISPYTDITAFGLRSISSYLKKHGFDSTMIFLTDTHDMHITKNRSMSTYSQELVQNIAELSGNSVLIGISLMSCFFHKVRDLTLRLKKYTSTPIVWGGIHAMAAWEECAKYSDFVIVGDGEHSLLSLAEALIKKSPDKICPSDLSHIDNLVFSTKNKIIISKNIGVNSEDLNSLPIPDIRPENKFIQSNNSLVPMGTDKFYQQQLNNQLFGLSNEIYYQTLASRGCPHSCTYCSNNYLKKISKGPYLRFRDPKHIIEELKEAVSAYPRISFIVFSDDSFSAMPHGLLNDFSVLYKNTINLPFRCLVSPATLNENKLDILIDTGLRSVQMGIESASPRILSLYKRAGGIEDIENAVFILNKKKDILMPPLYDIIVDNPFENKEDKLKTIRFLLKIKRPFHLQLFSLILYPKTELFDRALKEKIQYSRCFDIKNRQFFEIDPEYSNLLLILLKNRCPDHLVKILSNQVLFFFFSNKFFNIVFRFSFIVIKQTRKALYKLFKANN